MCLRCLKRLGMVDIGVLIVPKMGLIVPNLGFLGLARYDRRTRFFSLGKRHFHTECVSQLLRLLGGLLQGFLKCFGGWR